MKKPSPFVIPAAEARNVKSWRLPFWTDKPVWESEQVDSNIRSRSRVRIIDPRAATATHPTSDLASEVQVSDIETVPFPTAEELETVRREAYNEGLEQGLIEGRNLGHNDGFNQGQQDGQAQGLEAGTAAGYQAGFSQGEQEGQAKAQADVNMVVMRLERVIQSLQSRITERDQQLPEVLSKLVGAVCRQVVGHELSLGAKQIHQYILATLARLPEGENSVQVWVGPDDAKHLQASLADTGTTMNYEVDAALPAGACRIESEHTLTEYSSTAHLEQMLAELSEQMLAPAPVSALEPVEVAPVPETETETETETAVATTITAPDSDVPHPPAPESDHETQ